MNISCKDMNDGEILNEHHPEYPLYVATLYGDKVLTAKLSKRLSCSIKHLPLRLSFSYEYDVEKALDAGVTKDPTLVLNGEIFLEGLMQSEEITKKFQQLIS